MKDGLYHIEVFWLKELENFFNQHEINEIDFSQHVKEQERTATNRIFDLKDISIEFIKKGEIFEAEIKDNKIVKIVVRCRYKNQFDLCIPFTVKGKKLICRTAWLNKQDDLHNTLDIKKYVHGEYLQNKGTKKLTSSIGDLLQYKKNKRN